MMKLRSIPALDGYIDADPKYATAVKLDEPDNGFQHPMNKEINRLNSYKNWRCSYVQPRSLAKAGFFFINKDDLVRCAFCNIEIGQWQPGDDAMTDHRRFSSSCPLTRGLPCGNVPIEVDATPMPSSSGQDTCGKYGIEIRPNSYAENDPVPNGGLSLSKLGVQPSRGPAYQSYATLERRLGSFAEWPRSMKQKPEELSAAGFFYTGKGDQTICFHCGGGLKDWVDEDDPWEQHAKWFPKCNFVRLQKGQEYISEMCSKDTTAATGSAADDSNSQGPSALPAAAATVAAQSDEASTSSCPKQQEEMARPKETETKEQPAFAEDSNKSGGGSVSTMCKICFAKEVGVVFLPCGHIVACVDCAPALSTCAVCRKPLGATVRAFLS